MSVTLTDGAASRAAVSVCLRYPVSYEIRINTCVWLSKLSQKYRKNLDLPSSSPTRRSISGCARARSA